MKNLFFAIVCMLMTSFAFASEKKSNDLFNEKSETEIQYKITTDEFNVDTCYARFCWNSSETTRRCTEWQEVPCDTTIDLEVKRDDVPEGR